MFTNESDISQNYSTMMASIDNIDDLKELRMLLKSELTETRSYDHLVSQMMWMLVLFGGISSFFAAGVLYRLGKINRFITDKESRPDKRQIRKKK